MDELKGKLEKHRYHIRKLETLLRMLDNMSVEVNTVSNQFFFKDQIEQKKCKKIYQHLKIILTKDGTS